MLPVSLRRGHVKHSKPVLLDYTNRLHALRNPLRILVENEIFRLAVWANPLNEAKRGSDQVNVAERNVSEVRIMAKCSMLLLTFS